MLMKPKSYKKLRGSSNGYEYKTDNDNKNALREAKASESHLIGKVNHEIFNMPQ